MDESFVQLKYRVEGQLRKLETQQEILQLEQERLAKLELNLEAAKTAQLIVQQVSKTVQENAHRQIASIVSKCLSIIFEEPYEFCIKFEQKRGRTEASLVFKRGEIEFNPMSSSGGGVIDVASFALRLACICLSSPKVRRLIVMDEPFKYLSEEYREKIGSMLEHLSEKLNFQFVMVTHFKELEIGEVVRLK